MTDASTYDMPALPMAEHTTHFAPAIEAATCHVDLCTGSRAHTIEEASKGTSKTLTDPPQECAFALSHNMPPAMFSTRDVNQQACNSNAGIPFDTLQASSTSAQRPDRSCAVLCMVLRARRFPVSHTSTTDPLPTLAAELSLLRAPFTATPARTTWSTHKRIHQPIVGPACL